ncbi:hypothetical protein SynA1825c_00916 [Synechococcus sp. A18-25c]|nr:hypothetical protein SynA1560_00940 [Synechococcus sp. A15-60]QNJ19232.1 hypothetical protein SynA1825c_00916 [Synechococcus sp. A18-25c]
MYQADNKLPGMLSLNNWQRKRLKQRMVIHPRLLASGFLRILFCHLLRLNQGGEVEN